MHGKLGQNRGQKEEQKRLKCIIASLFYSFLSVSSLGTVGSAAEDGIPSQIQCRFIIFLQSFGKHTFKMNENANANENENENENKNISQ